MESLESGIETLKTEAGSLMGHLQHPTGFRVVQSRAPEAGGTGASAGHGGRNLSQVDLQHPIQGHLWPPPSAGPTSFSPCSSQLPCPAPCTCWIPLLPWVSGFPSNRHWCAQTTQHSQNSLGEEVSGQCRRYGSVVHSSLQDVIQVFGLWDFP